MKFLCFLLSLIIFVAPVLALDIDDELDFSVDEQIKKNYNTKAIEEDWLPPLPSTYTDENPQGSVQYSVEEFSIPKKYDTSYPAVKSENLYKIPSGKRIKVRSLSKVSSSTPKGAKITFESIYPQQFKNLNLPAKTKFKGVVVDSHPPQLTGNGGLIILKVTEVVYGGQSFPISAKIVIADDKKIFFNNIKGEREFMHNMSKTIKPAGSFMSKMWKTTCRLANGVPEVILSPITLATGAVVYVGGVAVSPVVAFFSKGKAITIPANTYFSIKMLDDAFLY